MEIQVTVNDSQLIKFLLLWIGYFFLRFLLIHSVRSSSIIFGWR